ncbi:MAG: hypothetical protein JO013_10240 [Alphaproteobacteria bacterium]|nr:hypothetical protein [Alphaproteobacteria bacterium]
MEADIVAFIAIAVAVMVGIVQLGRVLRAMMLHKTVREALTRENALGPALLDKLDEPKASGGGLGDDRIGLVLLAIGFAAIGFALIQGSADTIRNVSGMALFPLFVGAVLLGRFIWNARRGAEG